MKMHNILPLASMLTCVTVVTMTSDIEITRKIPAGKEGWTIGKDMFKIPSSLCGEIYNCSSFDAEATSVACTCSCPSHSATFIFHNKTRGCQNNEDVRALLGE